ncbi:MAG: DNA (cytosine-5-)-methyltransferase, partial [Flavobacteriales bacterium]|nr:DNA (cytosine-5-)-methyltransferase [Flavobacteriales bacterium]
MPGKRSTKVLRVAELFAGVGGFRIGLERAVSTSGRFKVVYSNQWEPGRKRQHASEVYVARFGADGHSCKDISTVDPEEIPEHDVLVGGFPCQDYSVASTLRNSKGLLGKKGVLWWEIHRLLSGTSKPPRFLVLENVDRLLSSPARQRGRDLAVMLRSLASLGYAMEWRVVNAADYGMPQRRKRVFLIGRRSDRSGAFNWSSDPKSVLEGNRGALARAFPCRLTGKVDRFKLADDLVELSANFGLDRGGTRFRSAGFMVNGNVFTGQVAPDHRGPYRVLG